MSAAELFTAYHDNEVAADQKYKGKTILVTGKVEGISKDIFDNSVVKLVGDGYFSSIDYTMESENEAASVKKRQRIFTELHL